MRRLRASIQKDFRLLSKDRVGLLLMFLMPIVLVLLITTLQNNTFKIVNDHQLKMVLLNKDQGALGNELAQALDDVGMFQLTMDTTRDTSDAIDLMEEHDALVTLVLDAEFSEKVNEKASEVASKALQELGLGADSLQGRSLDETSVVMYYSPVLQESYRYAVDGAIQSALKLVESKQMISIVFELMGQEETPKDLNSGLNSDAITIDSRSASKNGGTMVPNASQHNVPAWTLFAMFFMVTSMGSSLVKDKLSGSFIRLKTMPSGLVSSLISKQLVYLIVAQLQLLVIFSIGIWIFPSLGLPALNIPEHLGALGVVSLLSAFCAVSYALCIGVYASTQEQANGFGSVSVVILAALGGILVPLFAMPDAFRSLAIISPLHWCLDAFYGLFLTDASLGDISRSISAILIISIALQLLAWIGLRKKNLI